MGYSMWHVQRRPLNGAGAGWCALASHSRPELFLPLSRGSSSDPQG